MKNDSKIKTLLGQALKKVVKAGFHKRGFKDEFTPKEMEKIRQIDSFLREVNLHKDDPMFPSDNVKYTCISFKGNYVKKDGTVISCFYNHFVNQEDFNYNKIPYYVAKCIYRLGQKRCIEVFFCVNTLKATLINEKAVFLEGRKKVFLPERKGDNLYSATSIYTDIDLPEELIKLPDDEILSILMEDYSELFSNLQPSFICRSGGGIHLYYTFKVSDSLYNDDKKFAYIEMLRDLQNIFVDKGSDIRCVEPVRLLRVPYCVNRKPKYGKDGKEVRIIYNSNKRYTMSELQSKVRFLREGGMTSLFEGVINDIFMDYEVQTITDDELEEIIEIPIENLEEEKPKPKAKSQRTQKLIDFGYKGIQEYYNYNAEVHYQNRDLMVWLQNRESHDGVRHDLLFVFLVNWYVFNKIRTINGLVEKAKSLNDFFSPQLDELDVETTVKSAFKRFEENHRLKGIKNITIQNRFGFTQQEKEKCCKGIYCETQEEYLKERREKDMKGCREYYRTKVKPLNDAIMAARGPSEKEIAKENALQLLRDNPFMSTKEFCEKTGYSSMSFSRFNKEIGNTIEKRLAVRREEYFKVLDENPQISCKEFVEKFQCSRNVFWRTRVKWRKARGIEK